MMRLEVVTFGLSDSCRLEVEQVVAFLGPRSSYAFSYVEWLEDQIERRQRLAKGRPDRNSWILAEAYEQRHLI